MCKLGMKAKLTLVLTTLFWAWIVATIVVSCTGCSSTVTKLTASASGKNLNMDGYVMLGELETANPETATPQGRMIIGRVTYKSRKVGIPAGQKVPTTGYYKKTKTKSLFGTEEEILEMDFTAGSAEEAAKIIKNMPNTPDKPDTQNTVETKTENKGKTEGAAK